jgi:predicted dehydrogenase
MNRVAVIGLGKMGLLHASLLNVIPDVKLVAVCEKSRLINRFSKNVFSDVILVPNVSGLSELHLDAVYITTPTSTHYGIISTIIKQEICRDIFVEKPLSNSAKESKQLCDMVKKSGNTGVKMVGYNRRFNVTFRKAMEIIREGVLGEPVNFEGYAFSSDFLAGHQEGKRLNRGGVLRDLGCHAIDLAIWFMGNINLKSINSSKVSTNGVLDSTNFAVSSDKGISGQIKASWCEPKYRLPEIGFVMEGSKGQTLTVNDDKVELGNKQGETQVWHKQDLNDNTYFMLGGTDYFREDEEYTNAVKTGKTIEPGFSTALKVDEMIDSVEKSLAGQHYGESINSGWR